jgi:hypothetical protein
MSITVVISATTDVDPDESFRRLGDFERYADYTATVRSVVVEDRAGVPHSTWRVDFRGGILAWTERDEIDPVGRILAFEQVDGDLEKFVGRWAIDPEGAGSRLTFSAELDLGIPSLAPIVDPVARQALDSNMRTILRGLFADARLDLDESAPALSAP